MENQAEPQFFKGLVETMHASGGGAASRMFMFHLNDGNSFEIHPQCDDGIFAAIASVVSASHFAKCELTVVSYEQLGSGVRLVSFVNVPASP